MAIGAGDRALDHAAARHLAADWIAEPREARTNVGVAGDASQPLGVTGLLVSAVAEVLRMNVHVVRRLSVRGWFLPGKQAW
jgi:hypothetical protein